MPIFTYNPVCLIPRDVWLAVAMAMTCVTLMFATLHFAYSGPLSGLGLMKTGTTKTDLFFKIVSTLTEPDYVDFFPRWSTGEENLISKPKD